MEAMTSGGSRLWGDAAQQHSGMVQRGRKFLYLGGVADDDEHSETVETDNQTVNQDNPFSGKTIVVTGKV